MLRRLSSIGLTILLLAAAAWGPCAACAPSSQDPVSKHDCCKHQHTKKSCPHDERAFRTFEKAEKQSDGSVRAAAPVGILDEVVPLAVTAEPAMVETASSLSHAPPGLYLLNSSLLI